MGFFSKFFSTRRNAPPLPDRPDPVAEEGERAVEIARLRRWIPLYADYQSLCDEHSEQDLLITKKNEEIIGFFEGVTLTETRRTKGKYQGGSRGVSVRVMKGVTYRVGAHKGSFVPGPEKITAIDSGGTLVVSNLRAVYVGGKHTREFRWDKLIAFSTETEDDHLVFLLPVENRQKVSGIAVPGSAVDAISWVDERMKLAMAIHQDRLDEFLQGMQEDLADLLAESRSA